MVSKDYVAQLLKRLQGDEDRAMRAYRLGMVCALAWSEGLELPPNVFEEVVACTSIDEAIEVYRRHLLSRHVQLHVKEHELLAQKQREGE
jgi:hypothetical protein